MLIPMFPLRANLSIRALIILRRRCSHANEGLNFATGRWKSCSSTESAISDAAARMARRQSVWRPGQ